jgi:hypothetical protein
MDSFNDCTSLFNVCIVITAGILCGVASWGIEAYTFRRQRPFADFSQEEIRMAFRYAPEQRAAIVNRGTMSRQELGLLHQLNLQRIDAELKRRGVAL